MWKNQLGIWQTARKDLGSFLGLRCAWHLPPPATFCLLPFSGPDWRVLQFLRLPYYRLGEPLQESIQRQWHTLFQQPKEKKENAGTSFRLIVSLEGDLQPSRLERDHHSPKHTVAAEMPEQAAHTAALDYQDWWGQHGYFCADGAQTSSGLETIWPHFQALMCTPSHCVSGQE